MASTFAKILEQIEIDDVLNNIGLQRKSTVGAAIGSFGLFAVGVAVGAAASLMLAPKTGTEFREELTQRMNSLRDEMGTKFQSVMNKGGTYNPPS